MSSILYMIESTPQALLSQLLLKRRALACSEAEWRSAKYLREHFLEVIEFARTQARDG